MKFIENQIDMLKQTITDGVVSKDSPILIEQKELIIDFVCEINETMNIETDKSKVGAIVDKCFAELLDVE